MLCDRRWFTLVNDVTGKTQLYVPVILLHMMMKMLSLATEMVYFVLYINHNLDL